MINDLITKEGKTLLKSLTITPEQQIFSEDERDAVGYFFMRLSNMYGVSKIQSQWPDSESLRNAKREYAKDIGRFTREEISHAFDLAHKQKQEGSSRLDWPDVDAILGLIKNTGMTGSWGTAAHRLYKPEQFIGRGTKEDRRKAAISAIADLKNILGD